MKYMAVSLTSSIGTLSILGASFYFHNPNILWGLFGIAFIFILGLDEVHKHGGET
jgi:hypothetical protein